MRIVNKLVTLSASLALVATTFIAPSAFSKNDNNDKGANKVTICHFQGHIGDFVTFRSMDHPGGNSACDNQGGYVLEVGANGCENGHEAYEQYRGKSCSTGSNQDDG